MTVTNVKAFKDGPFWFYECTCGREAAVNKNMPWCAGCGVEYTTRHTEYGLTVRLDTNRKTPRFALAKAVNLSGGMRLAGDE